jgi:acetyl esterase/lipase
MLELRRIGLLAALLTSVVLAEPPAAAPEAPAKPVETQAEARARRVADLLKGVASHRNLEYARPDDKPVKLDLFVPEKAKRPLPLVIWVHGGGWQQGSKEGCPALPLVKDGFAVASINYRLTDRAPFPAQIQDCKAAVRYLRAHAKEYNLDPERFGAWGASAGGHLVALLGTTCGNAECEGGSLGNAEHSSGVQCVCDWFGPTDFLTYPADMAEVSPMLAKLFGGKLSEKRELAKLASPALHVKKPEDGKKTTIPPFLIVQGDKDPLVPDAQSRELADKLKEAGVENELVIVEGAGHGFGEKEKAAEFARVRAFFKKCLLKASAAEKSEASSPTLAPAKTN